LALLGIGWASSARWLSREVAEGVLLAIAGGALGLVFAVIAVPWHGRSRAGRDLNGRDLVTADGARSAPVAVINQPFGARYLCDRDPIDALFTLCDWSRGSRSDAFATCRRRPRPMGSAGDAPDLPDQIGLHRARRCAALGCGVSCASPSRLLAGKAQTVGALRAERCRQVAMKPRFQPARRGMRRKATGSSSRRISGWCAVRSRLAKSCRTSPECLRFPPPPLIFSEDDAVRLYQPRTTARRLDDLPLWPGPLDWSGWICARTCATRRSNTPPSRRGRAGRCSGAECSCLLPPCHKSPVMTACGHRR